jgi:hypothetical protein
MGEIAEDEMIEIRFAASLIYTLTSMHISAINQSCPLQTSGCKYLKPIYPGTSPRVVARSGKLPGAVSRAQPEFSVFKFNART